MSVRDCDTDARYGGDEFAVIQSETDLEGTRVAMETIRNAVYSATSTYFREQGIDRDGVTLSLGAANYIAHVTKPVLESRKDVHAAVEELIFKADAAAYASKDAGKNRSTIFEAGMESRRRSPAVVVEVDPHQPAYSKAS